MSFKTLKILWNSKKNAKELLLIIGKNALLGGRKSVRSQRFQCLTGVHQKQNEKKNENLAI